MECKITTKKGFSVTEDLLDGIRDKAFLEDKLPVLVVEFFKTRRRFWVVEEHYLTIDDDTGKVEFDGSV